MSASGSWSRRVGLLVTSSLVDSMFKRVVVMFALVAMLFQQNVAHAQAAALLEPVFNGVINRAVGAGILANLERRGLVTAANDAMFQSTMKWVGQAANDASYAGAAVGTVAAIAGAPVWLSTAISVGAIAAVGAVAWGAYQFSQVGTGSSVQLQLMPTPGASSPGGASSPSGASSPDGASSPSGGGTAPAQELPVEGALYASPGTSPAGYQALPSAMPFFVSTNNYLLQAGCTSARDCVLVAEIYNVQQQCSNNPTWANCLVSVPQSPSSYYTDQYNVRMPVFNPVESHILTTDAPPPQGSSDAGTWVQPVYTYSPSVQVFENPAYVAAQQGYVGDLQSLPITSDMLAAPLPDAITSQLAEKLLEKAAAMPGYDGYPYSAVDPVSTADIANAGVAPKWSDLVEGTPKAATDPGVTVAPDYFPTPSSGGTGSPTSTDCSQSGSSSLPGCVPLGSAPASDAVESSNASISLNPWSVGPASGTCPSPQTVSVLGTDYQFSFDPLCSVVEKLRPLVLALCALAAAFIIAMGVAL